MNSRWAHSDNNAFQSNEKSQEQDLVSLFDPEALANHIKYLQNLQMQMSLAQSQEYSFAPKQTSLNTYPSLSRVSEDQRSERLQSSLHPFPASGPSSLPTHHHAATSASNAPPSLTNYQIPARRYSLHRPRGSVSSDIEVPASSSSASHYRHNRHSSVSSRASVDTQESPTYKHAGMGFEDRRKSSAASALLSSTSYATTRTANEDAWIRGDHVDPLTILANEPPEEEELPSQHNAVATSSQHSYWNHSSDGASLPQSSFLNTSNTGRRVSVSAAAQQHKNLFLPYLPQASIPAFLSNGQLLIGVQHINRKNRSDAFVHTNSLDEEIFICGSKDRNRALEGDLVAVELLNVDEILRAKREKEEKKIRRNLSLSGASKSAAMDKAKSYTIGMSVALGMNQDEVLETRPIEKRKNDYEVTGQCMFFVDDDLSLDENFKPKYAGHVVAVLDRPSGQSYSGTLSMYRPNSLASKNQGHRRSVSMSDEATKYPRIVWFKPSDKRVPLIAISSDQVPADFLADPAAFSDQVYVASIKRWPTTSLHPFGTLHEKLGKMGNAHVEYQALLRDFNCRIYTPAESLSSGLTKRITSFDAPTLTGRKDLRDKDAFTLANDDMAITIERNLETGLLTLGVHVTDVAHYVKSDTPLDDELFNRVGVVHLLQGSVPLFPKKVYETLRFQENSDSLAVSVMIEIDPSGRVIKNTWIGKSIIRPRVAFSLFNAQKKLKEDPRLLLLEEIAILISMIRLDTDQYVPFEVLYCLNRCDGQDKYVGESNQLGFEAPRVLCCLQQVEHIANETVASFLIHTYPNAALLRSNARPKHLEDIVKLGKSYGLNFDVSSNATFMTSIANISDRNLQRLMVLKLHRMLSTAEYTVGVSNNKDISHFAYYAPYYTHFCHPLRHYIDVSVQRQLYSSFNKKPESQKDFKSLLVLTQSCNTLDYFYQNAQERSMHAHLCRIIHSINVDSGLMQHSGFVTGVSSSYIDVVVYDLCIEKRIYLDLLPLQEFEYLPRENAICLCWRSKTPSFPYVVKMLEINTPEYKKFKDSHFDKAKNDFAKKDYSGCNIQTLARSSLTNGHVNVEKDAKKEPVSSAEASMVHLLKSLHLTEKKNLQVVRLGSILPVLVFADTSYTYSLSLMTIMNPFA
ncbi:ribonuclease II family protein [Schizosaccharomyces japonicus yFS275]|uniref:Ribonuclease II family protein n=1 Tax=Schizosaccharomyces japonicus (strain yFS275 / FY16936) TaxID=402676 RepID=B6K3E8_SCHJY|nr:ribonuclease II family protein [Schizosaccharomyces japonicus yFS275]EEB08005.2 ribonuclease II family protein [Schizosaccharomyces japonicus yFS275]